MHFWYFCCYGQKYVILKSFLFTQSLIRSFFKFLFLNLYFDKTNGFCHLCRGGHFLLPIAAKGSKNAFAAESHRLAKTESFYQRKVSFLPNVRRWQFENFILSPSHSKRFTAFPVFSFAVGLAQQAFANSRRQFGGFCFIIIKV